MVTVAAEDLTSCGPRPPTECLIRILHALWWRP